MCIRDRHDRVVFIDFEAIFHSADFRGLPQTVDLITGTDDKWERYRGHGPKGS